MNNKKIPMGWGKHSSSLATVLTLFLSLGIAHNASAACAEGDYVCGESCCANLSGGVLTFSGSGMMSNFNETEVPWYSSRADITSVQFAPNSSITSIGKYALYKTGITSLKIPSSVTSIEDRAVQGTKLTSVEIPKGVTSIGHHAFQSSQLETLVLSDTVTTIGNSAFSSNKLETLVIPNSVTSIGEYAFSSNSLTGELVIPDSVTELKRYAFQYNDLNSIVIADSVADAGVFPFYRNNNLSELTISDSADVSKWASGTLRNLSNSLVINCQGDLDKCKEALSPFISVANGGTCTAASNSGICLKDGVQIVAADESHCIGGQYVWKAGKCQSLTENECNDTTRYYYNGNACKTRTAGGKITCKNSSYKVNDGYCDRIRYTPVEAAKVVRDDNTNEIVITFKK